MNVIPVTTSWTIHIGREDTTGTRTYLSSSVSITPAFPLSGMVALPDLYTPWDNTYFTNLLVDNINVSYLDGGCAKQYTVNYSTGRSAVYVGGPPEDKYPQYIDMSAEYYKYSANINVKDNFGHKIAGKELQNVKAINGFFLWVWPDRTIATELPIVARAVRCGYSISFDVYEDDLPSYLKVIMDRVNKINDNTFRGIPRGLALFLGADIQEGTLYDQRKWLIKLNFSIKAVNGEWVVDNGWNKVFRPIKNAWELIGNNNGQVLYESANFDDLLDLNVSSNGRPVFPGEF